MLKYVEQTLKLSPTDVRKKWEEAKVNTGNKYGYPVLVHNFKKLFTHDELKNLGWTVKSNSNLEYIEVENGSEYEKTFNKDFDRIIKEDHSNLSIGRHNDMPLDKFDITQLKKGAFVEMEHTNDIAVAVAICKDHLVENKDYYKALEVMEDTLKKNVKLQGKD